jgi:carbonic anhydrase
MNFKKICAVIFIAASVIVTNFCLAKISADEAMKKLVEGNNRYVAGKMAQKDLGDARRKEVLTKGQHPFATIITCSDSRVPPEIIFDQGIGDIFIIRVAGNVVDTVSLGSIEYGVEHVGTPVLMILGHQSCGAVKAAVFSKEAPEGFIGEIVKKIKPAADKAKSSGKQGDEMLDIAIKENIHNVYKEILERSPVVKELVHKKKLKVVLGEYQLESGKVQIFDAGKDH